MFKKLILWLLSDSEVYKETVKLEQKLANMEYKVAREHTHYKRFRGKNLRYDSLIILSKQNKILENDNILLKKEVEMYKQCISVHCK